MLRRPRKIRILLTGGGTGGHIYPLAAVAREMQKILIEKGYQPDIRYFGDPENFDLYLKSFDMRVTYIVSSKMRRYASILNFLDFFKFFVGLIQALWKIYWFMPHAAFSKGGPGALGVVKVCRFYAIPVVIHESDAVPGITTRLTARSAEIIEIAFGAAKKYLNSKADIRLVGNPVRAELEVIDSNPIIKADFGFNPKEPVVLFVGGSQGAEKINSFVLENLSILAKKFQIIHQVGQKNYADYRNESDFVLKAFDQTLKGRYFFAPYFEANLAKAYGAADIIVGRGGAGLIFEAAAAGKPTILVPLAESANDHQVHNAYEYERSGAAVVVEEENLLPSVIIGEIDRIFKNPAERERMAAAAKKFFIPNSARTIANDVLSLIFR